MKTPKKKINKYVSDKLQFVCYSDFQDYLRKGKAIPDYVAINGLLFTIEEYDMAGKQMTYFNKGSGLTVLVENSDRYNRFDDTEVSLQDFGCYRNDINYAD